MNILDLKANIPTLYHYDASKTSRVKCSASHSGSGACLEQDVESNIWAQIAFASRFFTSAESEDSTKKLELLAIVWSANTSEQIYSVNGLSFSPITKLSFRHSTKPMVNNQINQDFLGGRIA